MASDAFLLYAAASILFVILFYAFYQQRDHLYLRVRMSQMVLMDLSVHYMMIVVLCMREISVGNGKPFPCLIMNIASAMVLADTNAMFIMRGIQLIAAFSDTWIGHSPTKLYRFQLATSISKVGLIMTFAFIMFLTDGLHIRFCHKCKYNQ